MGPLRSSSALFPQYMTEIILRYQKFTVEQMRFLVQPGLRPGAGVVNQIKHAENINDLAERGEEQNTTILAKNRGVGKERMKKTVPTAK